MREITATDVILPVTVLIEYTRAYFWDIDSFHAGDMIYPYIGNTHEPIAVLAPTDGIITDYIMIPNVGGEIRVQTNYLYHGEIVFWDIVHFDTFQPDLENGSIIRQGDIIGWITEPHVGTNRQEWVLDFAMRNGPRGPNPNISPFYPGSYFDPFPFIEDDLGAFTRAYIHQAYGNPIPVANRTPLPTHER